MNQASWKKHFCSVSAQQWSFLNVAPQIYQLHTATFSMAYLYSGNAGA